MKELHTFVICAYKESAFLEECVKSLVSQTVKTNIVIATSTPNDTITQVAEKYGIEVFINTGEAGITGDWNFGASLSKTPFVTIAHQDDIYEPQFAEQVLKLANKRKNPLLIFTDYYEIKNGDRIDSSKVLKIKRLMNKVIRIFPSWKFARRLVLAFGNSICCPAVTYSENALKDFKFDSAFRFACDWDAWERIGRKKGSFVYITAPLMGHRIHEESETSKIMADGIRKKEEYTMFRRFWPKSIAKKLTKSYSKGAENNNV